MPRFAGHEQDAVFKTGQKELHSFPVGRVIEVGP
jgi:hypothetical protein